MRKTKGVAAGAPRPRSSLFHGGLIRQSAQGFCPGCRMGFATKDFTHAICVRAQILDNIGEGFALNLQDMGGNRLLEIQGLSLNLNRVKLDTCDRVSVIGANAPVVISHGQLLWLMADFSVCRISLVSALSHTFNEGVVASAEIAFVRYLSLIIQCSSYLVKLEQGLFLLCSGWPEVNGLTKNGILKSSKCSFERDEVRFLADSATQNIRKTIRLRRIGRSASAPFFEAVA
jgi:hypothetical protein